MEIRNTKPSDAGTYTVTVQNKNGSDTCSAVVTLLRKYFNRSIGFRENSYVHNLFSLILAARTADARVTRFTHGLSNTKVLEGGRLKLEAQVQGFPEPQIRWFKDGRLVIADGRAMTSVRETAVTNCLLCSLEILDCRADDSGTYVCAATSGSGTAISEASIVIQSSVAPSGAGRRGSGSRASVLRAHPPEFVQRLKSREVALGDDVRLSATVLATPAASILWEKDGVPLVINTAASPYETKASLRFFYLLHSFFLLHKMQEYAVFS